mmetsp:Transcript_2996/g.6453  ORF Transcript_2996/g.6453 Transcript_2996/m.6453 type:complete len:242 (-) Transcript_2996:225-950(-)
MMSGVMATSPLPSSSRSAPAAAAPTATRLWGLAERTAWKWMRSFSTPTSMRSPSTKSPARIFLAMGVSSSRCTARLSGRAPYLGSYPTSETKSSAESSADSVIFLSARRLPTSLICSSTILRSSPRPSAWKMINSSNRLRNSGRNRSRMASITRAFIDSYCAGSIDCSRIRSEPIFDVKMMIVLVKSMVRPCESVILPSSSTCSRMLNTSGCAFSISSNRTTLYGRRRTASVSCPPSSYPT